MSEVSLLSSFEDAFAQAIVKGYEALPISSLYKSNQLVKALSGNVRQVFVPTITTGGFLNYDKKNGIGSVNADITREAYTLDVYRSATITIDKTEADQQGLIDMMTEVSGGFLRNHAVPEIDAIRFSKWADKAKAFGKSKEEVVTSDNILDLIIEAVMNMENNGVMSEKTIFINTKAQWLLAKDPRLTGSLNWNGEAISADFRVKRLMEHRIIAVPSSRFASEIVLLNDDDGGFTWGAGSQEVNFMVLADEVAWYWTALQETVLAGYREMVTARSLNAYAMHIMMLHDAGIIKGYEDGVHVSLAPSVGGAKAKIKTAMPYTP
jgi:hypothetical protein